jgi:hypothetical protein
LVRRVLLSLYICIALIALAGGPALAQVDLPPELPKGDGGSLPLLPLPGLDQPAELDEEAERELVPSITLTRADFDEQLRYSGTAELEAWLGDIEIEGALGDVYFPGHLRLRGDLRSFPGTDITVAGELRCGGSLDLQGALSVDQAIRVDGRLTGTSAIRARAAISVGGDIEVQQGIAAGGWLYSGGSIRAVGRIWSGGLLECRGDLTSGLDCGGQDGIRCGGAISCGTELSSGAGILSGGSVTAGGRILLGGLLFCGTDPRAGREPEAVVRCSELVGGELAWGKIEIREGEEKEEKLTTEDTEKNSEERYANYGN